MIRDPKKPAKNRRVSSGRQRKQQHLLDVKVRSRKAAQQRNSRAISFVCKFILFTALVGGVWYGAHEGLRRFLWENPKYELASVTVKTDGSLDRQRILQSAGIREGANIFTISLASAREKLLALPAVENVEIERTLPDKIAIRVAERKPVAWIADRETGEGGAPAGAYLIDARSTIIDADRNRTEYLHLPIIAGVDTRQLTPGQPAPLPEVKAAVDLLRRSTDEAWLHPQSIDVSKGYCLILTDRNRSRITFQLDRLDDQLDRLSQLFDAVADRRQEIQTVNLMVERNIPVTFVVPQSPADAPTALLRDAGATTKPPLPVKRAEPVVKPKPREMPVRRAIPVNPRTKPFNG